MLKAFKTHIKKEFPELGKSPFLLACSGGVDSMALMHLCQACDLNFALAHCNFKLRQDASDEDARFVQKQAAAFEIAVHHTEFDTSAYIEKHKVSVQMAARNLRYAWFKKLMKTHGYTTLVTAHHADDALETFLINLSRGTGIDGLTGIPAKGNGLARPLLPFSRSEIIAYATTQGISWREDESNEDTKYLRNKIRHHIVPNLKELHPTFLANVLATQAHLQTTQAMTSQYIAQLKQQLFKLHNQGMKIEVDALLALQPLSGFLHALFKEYGFTAWKDMERLLRGTSGKAVYSSTHRLLKDRKYVLLETIAVSDDSSYNIQATDTFLKAPIPIQIEEVAEMEERAKNILYVDKKTLKYPLVVRKWRKGDYFYPLGMQGKKKVSKYFKDQKFDLIAKEKQWLLCTADSLVWIIGHRGDNRFKVTKETKTILKFTLQE